MSSPGKSSTTSTRPAKVSRSGRTISRTAKADATDEEQSNASITDDEMLPPHKRTRTRGNSDASAEHAPARSQATAKQPAVKKAPAVKKTYGAARKLSPAPDSGIGKEDVPLDQVFSSTKAAEVVPPPRKSLADTQMVAPAVQESPSHTSSLCSPPSTTSDSATSVAAAIVVHPPSPTRTSDESNCATSPEAAVESLPRPVAEEAPSTGYSVREVWSRRKVEGRPGYRVVGKALPVVVATTKKPTAAERTAAANAAAALAEAAAKKAARQAAALKDTVRISLEGKFDAPHFGVLLIC